MSEVKVNKLSPRSGTTVTLGDSGDTFTIPSGVTLSNAGTFTNFQSTGIDDNATSTAITIDSSERVGIGISNPTSPLHIKNASNPKFHVITASPTASYNAGFLVSASNSASASTRYATLALDADGGDGSGSDNFTIKKIGGSPGNVELTQEGSANILFKTADTERMRIDSSGNVGIGNTVASTINSENGTGNLVVGSGSGTEGITIYSGTTGEGTLQFADGTSGAATYVGQINYNHSNNYMSFATNSTERMRLDINGELIMRTGNKFVANRADNTRNISLYCNNAAGYLETSSDPLILNTQSYLGFEYQGSEKMRINTDGDLLIGRSSFSGSNPCKQFEINSSAIALRSGTSETGFVYHQEFHNPNGFIGYISTSGTSTSYNTSSDYRLKENVFYDFDATSRLKQLKPARFNFIADADTTVDGFLAHEVSSVVPEAISGEKDATETKEKVVVNANGQVIAENIEQADWEAGKIADEDGNTQYPTDSTWEATKVVPVYQGIDQSKLVPLLVKTIQELEARITQLENA